MADAPHALQLHVKLIDSRPPIWRRLQITPQASLDDLHKVLQTVMGWKNSHLYDFEIGRDRYSSPDPVPLEDTLDSTSKTLADFQFSEKDKFRYTYDFGDGWLHQITVETWSPIAADTPLPYCLKGKRACPPEDCGGIWGYEDLLEKLSDPEDPEYEDLLEWVGGDFDPEAFDLAAVNQALRQ